MESKVTHDSEVPAHGKQVVTACALIHHVFDGVTKVFMLKRAETKKFLPGVYEIPGGHIDFGEELVPGLKREVLEELNMNISVGDAFTAFDYHNPIKGSHSFQITYFAQFTDPIENITLHPEDHSEFSWFSYDELDAQADSLKPEGLNDIELICIKKGLKLLVGEQLSFS